jgi:acetylornithine aminotransferase
MPNAVMNTYARLPVEFSHGEGPWLYDTQGKQYLDALSGIAVCGLGHAHPAVTAAIADQAGKLLHVSNLFQIGLQTELGATLCRTADMDKVFFANSGAEANEAAIKLARLAGHKAGNTAPAIVVMESAFHGRTMATLSASGNRKIQAGFEPLLAGFIRAPFGNIQALETIAANNKQVVAVMMEPIQGEAGVFVPPAGYLAAVRRLCDEHNWLLILDEVQTGNGRTGHYFNYQLEGVLPDVVTTAKGLGNGMPIGACLARGAAADVLQPGNHGSTFGGNPLACRAALAVIDTIESAHLAERASNLGARIKERLGLRLAELDELVEIRGCGLMIGVELSCDCSCLVAAGLEDGVVMNVAGGNTVRLLPPLILSDEQADTLADRVGNTILKYAAGSR